MATKTKRGPNKTSFVRDFIQKNPTANRKAVEEAWLAAGHEGAISSALVSNLRTKMGLTGGSKAAGSHGAPESAKATARKPRRKKRGRPARHKVSEVVAEAPAVRMPRSSGRDRALAEVEADIDRLIFKLIALGGLEEIEDELRKVRRLLYRSYSEGGTARQ
jgi:hypothetical protein